MKNGKYNTARASQKSNSNNTKVSLDAVVTNEIEYYNKNTVLFNESTRIPWVVNQGSSHKFDIKQSTSKENEGVTSSTKWEVPGIMSFSVVTGPGWAATSTDAVNVALSQIMADIYSKSSSSTIPFDQTALANFLVATQSIAAHIGNAKRIMAARLYWAGRNLYVPRTLVRAMGYSYDDLIEHKARYASKLAEIITKFNRLRCLNMFNVYKRQYALFHNVYTDEDSDLGQLYIFNPAIGYEYDDLNDKLVAVNAPHYREEGGVDIVADFWEYLNWIDAKLEKWFGSQNLYYINGYLSRAYRDAEWFVIEQFDENACVEPALDEVLMMQIMNATINPVETASCTIQGDHVTGVLRWKPKAQTASGLNCGSDYMLRWYAQEITPDDNMEMTRLTHFLSQDPDNEDNYASFVNCGPEIVSWVNVWYYDMNTGAAYHYSFGSQVYFTNAEEAAGILGNVPATAYSEGVSAIVDIGSFRYIPLFTLGEAFFNGDDELSGYVARVLGDIYNYTHLAKDTWKGLNRAALYSLYNLTDVT